MKLVRWAAGGASAYVIYKYTIGKKAKGEPVLASPPKSGEDPSGKPATAKRPKTPSPRR